MSSVAAAYMQVPANSKYFQARASTYEYVPSTTVPPTAVSKTARTYVGTAPQTEFVNAGEVFASAGPTITLTASILQNSTTLTLNAAAPGLQLGMYLSGTNVLPGTFIVSQLSAGILGANGTTYVVSVAPTVGAVTNPVATGGATGTMYRDKGKRVTVVDTAGKHLATFALVQQYVPEAGGGATATGEGTASGNIYVQVWDAFNPANVTVVDGPA